MGRSTQKENPIQQCVGFGVGLTTPSCKND